MNASRHILITGGAGFIGSHTAEHLLRRGDRVTVLDAFAYSYDPIHKEHNVTLLSAYEGFCLIRADIRDKAVLEELFQNDCPDAVIHLAARAGVRPSLLDPEEYSDINIRGTLTILECMREYGCQQMVFASSSSVYGSRNKGPFSETDNVDVPVSPYAATKRAGELICATYNHLYNMDISCLRFFTVYGPRQRPEMAIHLFADRIRKGLPITMFGDGSSMRDYTFVEDIVQGVVAALDRPMGYRIINLGNSSPIRLDGLIKAVSEAVGKKAIVNQLPDQPGDVPMTFASVDRATQLLNYQPNTPLLDGLKAFVTWLNEYDPL
ncbi:MAG: NAD-dependent epimerase/dehydratase family protein [Myxococcota bacterium]|nr:NAD-dependent epimerase/dehydratase family protein [Myxococcota bacterium]